MTRKIKLPRNKPEEEQLANAVGSVQLACLALFDAHGHDCDCRLCEDAEGINYMAEVFLSIVLGQIFMFESKVLQQCGYRHYDLAELKADLEPEPQPEPQPEPEPLVVAG